MNAHSTILSAGLPRLHELLAHSHLLSDRQRQQSSLGAVGPLFCVHAEGRRDGKSVAIDRFFADQCSPAAALVALRNYGPEVDHLLFVVNASPERQRAFVRAGFRLVETQWLMVCLLADWQPSNGETASVQVERVTGAGDAVILGAIDGLQPIPVEELRDAGLRHFYCRVYETPIAYGRWAGYDETTAWVSDVYTAPLFRRRGHASNLMQSLLTDSRNAGADRSLLLSTAMAHRIYARLGYHDIAPVATLQAPSALLRRRRQRA